MRAPAVAAAALNVAADGHGVAGRAPVSTAAATLPAAVADHGMAWCAPASTATTAAAAAAAVNPGGTACEILDCSTASLSCNASLRCNMMPLAGLACGIILNLTPE